VREHFFTGTIIMAKSAAKTAKLKPAKKTSRRKPDKYRDIRVDLEKQRALLLEEAGETITNRTDVQAFPDLSDQASAEMEQNFVIRLKEREQKLLKKIDEALDRIATNSYGICVRCGGEIPYPRLKARPVTTLCIDCKTLEEQQERIRR
jgi:DnaK suppressor protein